MNNIPPGEREPKDELKRYVTNAMAVAYVYCIEAVRVFPTALKLALSLPDIIESGMERDSLRSESLLYLRLIAIGLQDELEKLQKDYYDLETQPSIADLTLKITTLGLCKHHIDLLRCHPHYETNRLAVENFIKAMKLSRHSQAVVIGCLYQLGVCTKRVERVTFHYNQFDEKPIRIVWIAEDKK